MPTVETRPAAHIAASVMARRRRGVSHGSPLFWSQARKPVAADAAVIAQPTHMKPA
ncbi:MAG TPA: hypothetical protein VHT27_14540 [Solirubrobacteraceae bacterium]|nr:hypothetical protein [Solirubrobacteraceae bacterium]